MKSKKQVRKRLSCDTGGTHALIDGDILIYRIAFTTKDDPEWIAMSRMNTYIDNITYDTQCSDYTIFLTGSNNFRTALYPEYKAGRAEKPLHYRLLKDYLINHEAAVVSEGQEADDELGIHQTDNTIICTIDKDLLMVPGRHYNFVKGTFKDVSNEEGRDTFYKQLLTGDSTDNIPGIPKIGPKKAAKIVEGCTDEISYQTAVLKAYKELLGLSEDEARARVNLTGQLIWIRRSPDEMWSLSI